MLNPMQCHFSSLTVHSSAESGKTTYHVEISTERPGKFYIGDPDQETLNIPDPHRTELIDLEGRLRKVLSEFESVMLSKGTDKAKQGNILKRYQGPLTQAVQDPLQYLISLLGVKQDKDRYIQALKNPKRVYARLTDRIGEHSSSASVEFVC